MRTRILATLSIGVFATVVLAGCSIVQDRVDQAVDDVVEEGVERAVEEGAGEGVDVEFGEDADLPEGFPSEVPLPDGTLSAGIGSPDGWWVTYTVANDAAVDALFAAFDDGGWTLVADASSAGLTQRDYENGTYAATVGAIPTDTEVQVTIAVAPVTE